MQFSLCQDVLVYHSRGEGRLLMTTQTNKQQHKNNSTMTATSPSLPSGLELLVEASMMRTPPTISEAITPKQAVNIPPLPPAPKKVQFAMSRIAVMPSFPMLAFDVGGDAKPMWLRLNPRANPKSKTKMLRAEKCQAEKFHFLWSINRHLQQERMNWRLAEKHVGALPRTAAPGCGLVKEKEDTL